MVFFCRIEKKNQIKFYFIALSRPREQITEYMGYTILHGHARPYITPSFYFLLTYQAYINVYSHDIVLTAFYNMLKLFTPKLHPLALDLCMV